MKNKYTAFSAIIIGLLSACQTQTVKTGPVIKGFAADSFSKFIVIDSANKMLGSYLNSIHYTMNDTDLQSLIIDVKQLRQYLDSNPTGEQITHLKLMFAHTLSYANSPMANTNAGYQSKALTIIVAGYNDSGKYIFYNNNSVLDYTQPCPPICPPGKAGSPLLVN